MVYVQARLPACKDRVKAMYAVFLHEAPASMAVDRLSNSCTLVSHPLIIRACSGREELVQVRFPGSCRFDWNQATSATKTRIALTRPVNHM